MPKLVASLAFAGLVVGMPVGVGAAPRDYDGWALIEVDVADDDALAELLALGVDPWSEHPRPGLVTVLASPQQRAAIAATNWTARTIVADVQPQLERERERLAARTQPAAGADFFADFRDLDEIDAQIDALAAAAPELVTVLELGDSLEGRPIRALRITADGDDDRPGVFVTSGQHAREWIAVTSGMYLADQLVARAAEPMFAMALEQVQIVIVPVVNPDGYVHTWTADRYWRKNRRDGVGVDTNRNFGWGWGGVGASMVPEEENYGGPGPFSEPETQVVRDFVLDHPELVAHLDLHSFGQLVLYPWGDVEALAPDDAALSATANAAATAMSMNGASYTPLQGVALYPAAGNAIDWTYGEAGLHSLTFEVRPTVDEFEVGFTPPPQLIVPVGEDVLAGAWELIAWAVDVAPDPPGEDTSTGDGSSSGGSSSTTDGSTSGGDETTTGGALGTETTAPATTLDTGDSSSGGASLDEGSGCGCSHRSERSLGLAVFALASLFRRRRRVGLR